MTVLEFIGLTLVFIIIVAYATFKFVLQKRKTKDDDSATLNVQSSEINPESDIPDPEGKEIHGKPKNKS